MSDETDLVAAAIIEASLALDPVLELLELRPDEIKPGDRTKAEAFAANAPSLYERDLDSERLFMTLDVAVSTIQADPSYAGGYALVAGCIYRLGRGVGESFDKRALAAALPWAYRATQIQPEDPDGWEMYVLLHCYLGDFKSSETALGEVYRLFGDNDLYARLAYHYFRLQGDAKQAVNWGALAWQTEWNSKRLVAMLETLAALYRERGQTQKALDAYRVISERDHNNEWAFHYAADCALELGDIESAREFNDAALKLAQYPLFMELQKSIRRASGARAGVRRPNTSRRSAASSRRVPTTRIVPAPPPLSEPDEIVPAPPTVDDSKPKAAPPRQTTGPIKPPQSGKPTSASTRRPLTKPPTTKPVTKPPVSRPVTKPPAPRRRPD